MAKEQTHSLSMESSKNNLLLAVNYKFSELKEVEVGLCSRSFSPKLYMFDWDKQKYAEFNLTTFTLFYSKFDEMKSAYLNPESFERETKIGKKVTLKKKLVFPIDKNISVKMENGFFEICCHTHGIKLDSTDLNNLSMIMDILFNHMSKMMLNAMNIKTFYDRYVTHCVGTSKTVLEASEFQWLPHEQSCPHTIDFYRLFLEIPFICGDFQISKNKFDYVLTN
jgi:hypothetical protein